MVALFNLFIARPLLALIPALILLAASRAGPSRWAVFAAFSWVAYAGLEFANSRRWTCSGECNIRVDLLLLAPLLCALFAIGLGHAAWNAHKRSRAGQPPS